MTPIFIYKRLKKATAPVAELTLANPGVRVESSEVQIQDVLRVLLPRKATFSEWRDGELTKRAPQSPEEHVVAALRRFLPRPYFASRDVPKSFQPRYTRSVEVPDVP